jgi:hypothetical protein
MDPRCFGFVDAPPVDALSAAMEGLQASGALDAREALLPLGHALALLPVDVHIGKLLVRIPCQSGLFVALHGMLRDIHLSNRREGRATCGGGCAARALVALQSSFAPPRLPVCWMGPPRTSSSQLPHCWVNTDTLHLGSLQVYASALHMLAPILTIAAALAVRSPFGHLNTVTDESARRNATSLRAALVSPHGDALSLLHVYDAWLAVREGGRAGERRGAARWCREHSIDESRLVEMAKLRRQFEDVLGEEALRAIATASGEVEMRGQGRRRGAGGAARREATKELLRLQRSRDTERGRRLLQIGCTEGGAGSSSGEEGSEGGGSRCLSGGSCKRRRSRGNNDGDAQLRRMRELDLLAHADIAHHASAADAVLTPDDVTLLAVLLGFSLYPRVAVPDPANTRRRASDARFVTANVPEAFVHPGSVCAGQEARVTPKHIAMYENLLKTSRTFLVNVTPLPAMPLLLLYAQSVHTDLSGTTFAGAAHFRSLVCYLLPLAQKGPGGSVFLG